MDDALFADICGRQFAAAEEMLRAAISACPDDQWAARGDEAPFWQQVLHTVLVTNFYQLDAPKCDEDRACDERVMRDLGEPMRDWSEPEAERMWKTLSGMTDAKFVPPRVLSKVVILQYVEEMSRATTRMLDRIRRGEGSEPNTMTWTGPTLADRVVYNIRHEQHHIGRLHSLLGRRCGAKLNWNRVGEKAR